MKTGISFLFFFFRHLYTHTHREIHNHTEKGLHIRTKGHCMNNCLSETVHYVISNEHVVTYKILYFTHICVLFIYSMCICI